MVHTPKKRYTIVVVEDEELLLKAITRKLELNDFDVVSCMAGAQAIDYLEHFPQLPDAIWLDYYLKDMNGLEFMQHIRTNKLWEDIPVMVVSNSADPEKVHRMLGLGASKYLLKAEYRLEDIILALREFVQAH